MMVNWRGGGGVRGRREGFRGSLIVCACFMDPGINERYKAGTEWERGRMKGGGTPFELYLRTVSNKYNDLSTKLLPRPFGFRAVTSSTMTSKPLNWEGDSCLGRN